MHVATEVPLLAGLPKVELARLISDLEELELATGDTLEDADLSVWLYFVVNGQVEICTGEGERAVPFAVVGAGDLFGESNLLDRAPTQLRAKALMKSKLVRVPIKRVKRLVESEPRVATLLMESLVAKVEAATDELARLRQMLAAYMDEVWSSVPPPHPENAVAAMPEPVQEGHIRNRTAVQQSKPALPKLSPAVLKVGGIAASSVLAGIIYLMQRDSPQLAAACAVLSWAAFNWLLGTIPDYVIALTASVMVVLTGVAGTNVAFGGFAQASWFLLLGVLGIGAAVSRSGLLYRSALHMLRLLPPTYRGQSFAIALTGLLFTPLLPSANSRTALASPLARELSEAMRFPALGRGSAGLAMSSFLGFGQMYFMFLNGTNICLLAWSLMPSAARQQVTWGVWLWVALPLSLVTFIGSYLAVLAFFRPELSASVSRRTILAQLQVLGPMTRLEKVTATVLALVLFGLVTQALHGVDLAWISMGGFLVLVVLGAIDRNGLKLMDWSFLLLVGALVSLSDVTRAAGLTDRLSHWIGPFLAPLGGSPVLFLGAIALLTLAVRLAVPIQQAVLVMIISLLPVSTQLGYHPFIVVLVVLAMSNSWVLPQQNSMYMTVYSCTEERSFTHGQVRPLALVHAAVGFMAVLISVPFWQMLGWIPR